MPGLHKACDAAINRENSERKCPSDSGAVVETLGSIWPDGLKYSVSWLIGEI